MITETDEKIISKFQDHYNALVQNVKNRLDFEFVQYADISYNNVLQETVFYVYEKDQEGQLVEPSKITPIKISFTNSQIIDLMFLRARYKTDEEIDKKFTEIGEYCVNELLKQLQSTPYDFYDVIADENEALRGIVDQVFRKTIASDLL